MTVGESERFVGENERQASFDEETGFGYHGKRYLAHWLGRWTTADPMGAVDGLNLYRFGRNNPVVFQDPSGTSALTNPDAPPTGERPPLAPGRLAPPIPAPNTGPTEPPSAPQPEAKPEPDPDSATGPNRSFDTYNPRAAPDADKPPITSQEPAGDPIDRGLTRGFMRGLSGFGTLDELKEHFSDPENLLNAGKDLLNPAEAGIRLLEGLGENAIGLGEDIAKTGDESLDYEQRAEGGGSAVGRGVLILGTLLGFRGARGAGIVNRGGRFGHLDSSRLPGEVGHHMPQNAYNRSMGRTRGDGPAIGMTIEDHAKTRTYKGRGNRTMREDAGLTAKQRMLKDIRDIRQLFGKKYNQAILEMMKYARTLPEYARPPRRKP